MPQSDRNNGLFHCLLQARDGEVHHGKQTGGQARTVRRGYLRAASHKPRQQAMELKLPDIDHVWIMCLNNCCFAQRAACIRGQTVHTPLADSWFEVRRGKKKKTVWRHVFICFCYSRTCVKDCFQHSIIFTCSAYLFPDTLSCFGVRVNLLLWRFFTAKYIACACF